LAGAAIGRIPAGMRVFVTGASGYIGSAVTAALARAGHDVVGLVRSAEKARHVEALEARAEVGDLATPAGWVPAARECAALVHCAAESSARTWELDGKTLDELLALTAGAGRPRSVVYTSGVWVYGSTATRLVDETSALAPLPMSAPRVEHERKVLAASRGAVRALVLRPGCVYGGKGGLTAPWFEAASRGRPASIVGTGRERWTMVHVDDLADAYVRAVESPLGGEVFNVTDRSRFTLAECGRAAMRAAGAPGEPEIVPVDAAKAKMGPVAEALAFDQHVDSRKAATLLGWQPRHGGFVDGVDRYWRAWKATRPA
jgi:nucleoside-diphosphate-sugar epimerase